MKLRRVPPIAALFLLTLLAVTAQTPAPGGATTVSPELTLPVTTRGQTVTIYGTFPTAPVKVNLFSGKPNDPDIPIDATVSDDKKSIAFKMPAGGPVGNFLVFVEAGGQSIAVPGELRIQPDEMAKVTLDSIAPATDYQSSGSGGYDFVMSGQNLALQASDNTVIAVGYGPLEAGTAAECTSRDTMEKAQKICLSYDPGMEGQKLNVMNYRSRRYEGPASFQIRVGNNTSNAQKVTFSALRAETLRFVAIAVFLLLAAVVFALVVRGVRDSKIAGEDSGPLAAFFLDRQTNSFSLSKFQVLAWTAVSVFGFVYLYLCRTMVQWNFGFPPIPEGLPTLLGVSAGTTVAATGITAQHGSKGAGPIRPSMADFISSGGIIAGDRFQFFVWTLVGCLGFLGIILSSDPASLTQLPDINGTFLTLMGISSAGYLAGKLVRNPGPIIQLLTIAEITPATDTNHAVMKLEVKGQNLSDQAVVKIDQKELGPKQFSIAGITKQDSTANSPYYSTMLVTLSEADSYLSGSHLMVIVNDDGQSATESFPLNPLSLDPVKDPIKAGQDPTIVNLVGRNFAAGFHGTWTDATGASFIIPDADIRFVDENHLDVTIVPGPVGAGKVILETPARLLGVADIKVA